MKFSKKEMIKKLEADIDSRDSFRRSLEEDLDSLKPGDIPDYDDEISRLIERIANEEGQIEAYQSILDYLSD